MKAGENMSAAWKESKQENTEGTRLSPDGVALRSHGTPESPILSRVEMIILCWLEPGARVTKMMHYTIRNPSRGV